MNSATGRSPGAVLSVGGWIAVAPASTAAFFGPRYQVKNYGIVISLVFLRPSRAG